MNVNMKIVKERSPVNEISDLPTGILPRHIVRGSADGSHCSAPQESRGRRCCNLAIPCYKDGDKKVSRIT